MEFAICNEIFKERNDIARTFSYVKETGYDGIELAPFTFSQYVTDISPETRKEIVKRAREVDLDVIGIHWVFVGPEGLHINHPDKEHRDRAAQYLVDLARFCGDVGGHVMIFGSPKQRNVHESLTYAQAFEYTAAVFEQALPACEKHGVTICMEPLTHLETNFCTSAADTVRLIERVNHPKFRLLLDTKAMTFEEEDRPAYAAALAAVRDSMSGVLTAAGRVLRDCGIEDVASVLGPLAHAVTDEALKASSVSAQRSVDPPSPHSR